MRCFLIPILIGLVGCGADDPDDLEAGDAGSRDGSELADAGSLEPDASASDTGVLPNEVTLGGDRPAQLILPEAYDGGPLPLVVLLHGYSIDAAAQDSYFQMSARVDSRGFFLLLPNGTREESGAMNRFWNATDACCNFYGSDVDDVAYLLGLIDEAGTTFAIESVHLVGHSNGGFMAYRMACDAPEMIDSIASLAGATFFDEARCQPGEPTRVLQIHGTNDTTILYAGVTAGAMRYPGAEETVRRWASRASCDLTADDGSALDLDVFVPGNETDVEIYEAGCALGIEVGLWRINGSGHVPMLSQDFADRVLDWSLRP